MGYYLFALAVAEGSVSSAAAVDRDDLSCVSVFLELSGPVNYSLRTDIDRVRILCHPLVILSIDLKHDGSN